MGHRERERGHPGGHHRDQADGEPGEPEEEICDAIVRTEGVGAHDGECTGFTYTITEFARSTLYGHLDTVPEQGNGTARIEGDVMYGLGTTDMKAGLAVMLHLLEDEAVRQGPYDVVGVFYDKEEGPAHENGLEVVLDAVAASRGTSEPPISSTTKRRGSPTTSSAWKPSTEKSSIT